MTDISPYLNRLDILQDTAEQVIKDFGMVGLKINFTGNPQTAYKELSDQILPHIEKLQKENFQNFYNLMYRVDVSELQIKKAIQDSKDRSFPEIATELILQRELIKVVFRKQYSK